MKKYLILMVCIFFTTNFTNAQIANLDSGLVAYWLLNEAVGSSVFDSSGNVHTGTILGDVVLGEVGKFSKAVAFGSLDGRITVPSLPDSIFGTNDFSISFWLKTNGSNEMVLFNKRTNSSSATDATITGSVTIVGEARMKFRGDDGVDHVLGDNMIINDDFWHHFTSIRKSDSLFLFIDGNLDDSKQIGSSVDFMSTLDFLIGRTNYLGGNSYEGLIDDFRVYDRALTNDEIIVIANPFENELLDLDNNQVPQSWNLETIGGGPGIVNGRLQANTTDALSRLTRNGFVPTETDFIKLEFDGNIAFSSWGLHQSVHLETSLGDLLSFTDTVADVNFGNVNKARIQFNGINIYEENLPLEFTNYHYTATVKNDLFRYKAEKISDGSVLFDTTLILSQGSFEVPKVNEIRFQTNTTTNNNSWIDNLKVELEDDETPPAQIQDFSVVENFGSSVKLRWTATGDDSTDGIATSYEIRKSASEITETNFSSAILVSNIPTPSFSGISDSITVTGLTSGTQYYFGIKVIDNADFESPISIQTNLGRAEITSITDVQNDNGGMVRITFDGSLNDYNSGTGLAVSQYAILRKINPNFAPIGKGISQIYESLPSGNWEEVGSVTAFGQQSYTITVPTLADSNSTGNNVFEFLVRTQAFNNQLNQFNSVSEIVSGYSIDNLAPSIPANQNFINNGNGTITATWNSISDLDLDFYTIYAEDLNGNFNLVTQVLPTNSPTQSETFAELTNTSNYHIGSVDVNGNESLPFEDRITSLEIEINGNDIILIWVGKQNATLYKIYRSLSPEFLNAIQIGTYTANGIEPSFIDLGASQNSDKFFYFVTWEN